MTTALESYKPATVERYGNELRETYDERPDELKYRALETRVVQHAFVKGAEVLDVGCDAVEVRLYRFGRPDGIREVEGNLSGMYTNVVFASDRRTSAADGVASATRWLDTASASWNYAITYDTTIEGASAACRCDPRGEYGGIRSVHISLERGMRIEVSEDGVTIAGTSEASAPNAETSVAPMGEGEVADDGEVPLEERDPSAVIDNAVSLIKRKVNHVAIKLDNDRSTFGVSEIYQDVASATLRVAYRDKVYNKAVCETFPLYTPNDVPQYEHARRMVMVALRVVVSMERELGKFNASVGRGWEAIV